MSTDTQSEAEKIEGAVAVRCPNCGKEAFIYGYYLAKKMEKVVSCRSCPYRKKHLMKWPADAFYQVEVCNDVLWGWSREHFVSIREFIASKERKQNPREHRKIPAHFLNVKRRSTIVKAIDRFLKST